jgi:hypothetical protein
MEHLPRAVTVFGVLSAICLTLLAAGCGAEPPRGEIAPAPAEPLAPDLATPEASVRSYLAWTTYASRMANSEVASHAMDPYWGVHVDSYIEKLRQEDNKGIDQRLARFEVRSTSAEVTSAVVTASEDWTYRYFSLKDQTYLTPQYSVSYDTTYTLTLVDGKWFVSDVQAAPRGELK